MQRGLLLTCLMLAASAYAEKDKTITFCSEAFPDALSATIALSQTAYNFSSHVYNNLVERTPGTTVVEPALAEDWIVSRDEKSVVFFLRKNVYFQENDIFRPSRPMNADDVVFSFMRQKDPSHPFYGVGGGGNQYFEALNYDEIILDVVKRGEYEVEFVLSQPDSSLIPNLALAVMHILSKEYADQVLAAGQPELLFNKPIGTNKFQIDRVVENEQIELKRFSRSWKGVSNLDRIIFRPIIDGHQRWLELKRGNCDIMNFPIQEDLNSIKKNKNVVLESSLGLNVGYLAYNTLTPPFDQIEVRKALNMAVNRDKIIEEIFGITGERAKSPIPPSMWSYNPTLADTEYDPKTAKKILAEAGVTNLHTKIWAMPVQRVYNPDGFKMAKMIQTDWKKIGVEAEIVSMDWGDYLSKGASIEREGAFMVGWYSDNGDPDNMLSILSCKSVGISNYANWCFEDFDNHIRAAQISSDFSVRRDHYEKAQKIFEDNSPWLPISHGKVFTVRNLKVQNYVPDPLGYLILTELDIED